jgi:hypothetical protein
MWGDLRNRGKMTKPIGSDFTPIHAKLKRRCSECSTVIEKGGPALASIKDGKIRKVVCSEACRVEFDARFWQGVARRRAARQDPRLEDADADVDAEWRDGEAHGRDEQ